MAQTLATTPKSRAPGQLRSVQSLRAIAALFVVAFHSTLFWHDKFDPSVTRWENGNSGVDLFFVISGFIMVLSSRRLRDRPDGWRQFIVLRLVRIAPLYWLVTTAKLVVIVAVPTMAVHTRPTGWNILASFLFVPSRDAAGIVRPVLDVGWTLSFEMLFYVVFATSLFFTLDPVVVVGPAMAALALVSIARGTNWPAVITLADPIVLEFVFGVVIGHAFLGKWLPRAFSLCMLPISAAGLLCLTLVPTDGRWERVAIWGLAAAATLYGSVLAERWMDRYLPNLLVEIGEASYSMYLTHGFVLPVIGLATPKSKLTLSSAAFLGVSLERRLFWAEIVASNN